MSDRIAIAGAGLSGAAIARTLAEAGIAVTVFETRPHVAGNCHTERDPETGIQLHRYGPHIFHTDDDRVWAFVNRFARFLPYRHSVRSTVGGRVFSLPVNLHTINQFFDRALRPEEARTFIAAGTEGQPDAAANFEACALALIGRPLYEAFFRGYSEKQWGCPAREIPAAVLGRLPLRFNYDDSYFNHRHQAMPVEGYTAMVTRMLDHPLIELRLGCGFSPGWAPRWRHLFWTGPLDAFFGHSLGRLGYRSLRFESFRATGDWQGCAVMNFPDPTVAMTRMTEHRHFAPWESHDQTVVTREYPIDCGPADTPFYPTRRTADLLLAARYAEHAASLGNVSFAGRLGTYRYLDMDVTLREALDLAEAWLAAERLSAPLPRRKAHA